MSGGTTYDIDERLLNTPCMKGLNQNYCQAWLDSLNEILKNNSKTEFNVLLQSIKSKKAKAILRLTKRKGVVSTVQPNRMKEDAAYIFTFMILQRLAKIHLFYVCQVGSRMDYKYLVDGMPKQFQVEVSGTTIPNGGRERLNAKLRYLHKHIPNSEGCVSILAFTDRINIVKEV